MFNLSTTVLRLNIKHDSSPGLIRFSFLFSNSKEKVLNSSVMTESDTDLVVEYEEQPGGTTSHTEGEDSTASDSNTVNQDQDQDQDSFSILEGDSLLDGEGPQPDMPPLFVHVTCSINMKSCHGSTPIQTLPTCLSECWQSPSLDFNSHLLVSFQFSNCCFGFSLFSGRR